MAQFVIANNVNTQLAAALPSSGAGSTTVVLASSANLPTLNIAIGQMMPLTLNDAATGAIYETVYVTAISGATLTVLRAQEGTSSLNWGVGDLAFCGPTAGTAGLSTMRTQYQAAASYNSSQTLTAAIAGESIGFTGSSASTFTMPGQSTMPPLTPTAVYNDGTAALTLTANGSDKFVVATGQVTSIVMQPGDDFTFYASTTANLWTAASGSALRQYEPLVVGAATASQHAVQLGQVASVVGAARNLRALVSALGNSLTVTASEIIVKSALGGNATTLGNFNQTVSTTGTGIGGVVGPALASGGFAAVYAAWGPVVGAGAFIANASSSVGEVYGGTLPVGYTESALVSLWILSATSFVPAFQQDRKVMIGLTGVLVTSTQQASLTPLNIAAWIPPNAKRVWGALQALTNATAQAIHLLVSSASFNCGQNDASVTNTWPVNNDGYSFPFAGLDLSVSQTLYYIFTSAGTPTATISLTAYEF